MTQHEITAATALLDERGGMLEPGWARQPLWQYRRAQVRAPWYRRKEWDYYHLLSDAQQKGLAVTVSDLGYASLIAVCWLDFGARTHAQADLLLPLTRGRLGLDEDGVSSRVSVDKPRLRLDYRVEGGERRLDFSAPELETGSGRGLRARLCFSSAADHESMNILSGWDVSPRAFYYNRKVNNMQVHGEVWTAGAEGDPTLRFSPDDSVAGLDWGRGVWTWRNRWYWASVSGSVDGQPFGLNLGYGFGDRPRASENVIFHAGRAHKIGNIEFPFSPRDYLQPWETRSDDGRLELRFEPVLDRNSHSNLLVIRSEQHQVFGHFSGQCTLDDGRVLRFQRLLGFAEDVYNRF